jgi:hypothetical protein
VDKNKRRQFVIFRLLLIVIFSWTLAGQARSSEGGKRCARPAPKVVGKTIKECEASANKLEQFFEACSENPPTYYNKDVMSAEDECYRKIMVRALDQRLLVLKRNNREQFRKEMQLQAVFNKLVGKFCLESDEGATGEGAYGCGMLLTRYRAQQALAIAQAKLQLKGGTLKLKKVRSFQSFAVGLCSMPNEVWQEKRAPDSCAEKVLSEIEKVVGGD